MRENGKKKNSFPSLSFLPPFSHLQEIQPLRIMPDRPLVQRPVDGGEGGPVHARRGELVLPALAARVKVVDREDDLGQILPPRPLGERRARPGRRVQVPVEHRRGAGLPVVDVEDGGARVEAPPDEPREGLEGRAAEEQIRLGLVVAPAVDPASAEQIRLAPVRPQQQDLDAVEPPRKGAHAQLLDAGDLPSVAGPALRARELVDELEPFHHVLRQALVKGEDDHAPGPARGDLESQAAHDVAQSATLCTRCELR